MKTKITQSGNSKAVRIPKILADALELKIGDEVKLEQTDGGITIRAQRQPRAGWAKQFKAMAAANEDKPLMPDVFADEE